MSALRVNSGTSNEKSAQGFRDLRFAQANHIAEMECLLLSRRRASPNRSTASGQHQSKRIIVPARRPPARARAVHFRAGSGCRTGSSGRFGNGGLEGRGFLDGSWSRPDMRLLSERNATSANDQDFTSGYCQKGNRSHRVCRPNRQIGAALATKRLIAKTLRDGRGGSRTLDAMVSPVQNW
jgi:hypothetical protein